MKILIDTHIWLWWISGDSSLPTSASDLISHPENQVFVSAISFWEIVVKAQLGKLSVDEDLEQSLERDNFIALPFRPAHAVMVRSLPMHHRDPFDRALLAQAKSEAIVFLSSDKGLRPYSPELDLVLT